MRVIVIFGPPGSGKGTQAELLYEKLNLSHVSTGDILRHEVESRSVLGKIIRGIMKKGELINDKTIDSLIEKRLNSFELEGFIFDGYPRDLKQAGVFLSFMKKRNIRDFIVVNIIIPEKELIRRLLKRAKIEGREDDNKNTILNRIRVYKEETEPVIKLFRKNKVRVINIKGNGKIKDVNKEIIMSL